MYPDGGVVAAVPPPLLQRQPVLRPAQPRPRAARRVQAEQLWGASLNDVDTLQPAQYIAMNNN